MNDERIKSCFHNCVFVESDPATANFGTCFGDNNHIFAEDKAGTVCVCGQKKLTDGNNGQFMADRWLQ